MRSPRMTRMALAIAALVALCGLPPSGRAATGPATLTINFGNGKVTARDASGPAIAGGQLGGFKAFLKMENMTGIQGSSKEAGQPAGQPWWEVILRVDGQLVLDAAASRFPVPPGQQKQVYAGTLKGECTQYVVDAGSGRRRKLAQGTIRIEGSTTLTYPPEPNAGITGTLGGRITGGSNPIGMGQYVSGTYSSRMPTRYEDPSPFDLTGMRITFSTQQK